MLLFILENNKNIYFIILNIHFQKNCTTNRLKLYYNLKVLYLLLLYFLNVKFNLIILAV